jgi:hypothetical protein
VTYEKTGVFSARNDGKNIKCIFEYSPIKITKHTDDILRATVDEAIDDHESQHLYLRLFNDENQLIDEHLLENLTEKIFTPNFKLPVVRYQFKGVIDLSQFNLNDHKYYSCCFENDLNHTSKCSYFRFRKTVPFRDRRNKNKMMHMNVNHQALVYYEKLDKIHVKFALVSLLFGLFLFITSIFVLFIKCDQTRGPRGGDGVDCRANNPSSPHVFTIPVREQERYTIKNDLYTRYNLSPVTIIDANELPPAYSETTTK